MHGHSRLWRTLALAVALVGASTPARAQTHWAGALLGTNEVPPNASPATGWADIFLNGDLLTVDMYWRGLIGGPPAAAHLHCCTAPGSNIGVAIGFSPFPATTSGVFTNTYDLLNSAVYTANFRNNFGGGTAAGARAALINGLNTGNAYVNVHNAQFPGGEVRANVVATPEPASVVLMATGLAAFGAVGWRRRRTA